MCEDLTSIALIWQIIRKRRNRDISLDSRAFHDTQATWLICFPCLQGYGRNVFVNFGIWMGRLNLL